VTQAFLPLLRQGRGRIVNIGSISDRMATPVLGAYSASKFALAALTDALRLEVQPWGIEVALIEPGAVATPIWKKGRTSGAALRQGLSPEEEALYADAVAAIVAHALSAPRPKTRYLIGKRTRVRSIIARLPDRLRDRLLTTALRLPKPGIKLCAPDGDSGWART
jgi:NAD(P)-dependent dehydrogenase (short-subunit alcohol dehydrogenase family)